MSLRLVRLNGIIVHLLLLVVVFPIIVLLLVIVPTAEIAKDFALLAETVVCQALRAYPE